MKLFRGDSRSNILTQPELYRFDGLRSKAFGKGDPAYIDKHGLLDSVRKHIKPENSSDQDFYNKTEFISFSTDIERAKFWLSNKGKLTLSKCDEDYEETRYLFVFDIPEDKLTKKENGIYSFHFMCNPSLKSANTNDPIFNAAKHLIYGTNGCPICNLKDELHEIILIDTNEFLESNQEKAIEGAMEFAKKDKEWLLLPFDVMDKNGFKYARIPRADFWYVQHYTSEE